METLNSWRTQNFKIVRGKSKMKINQFRLRKNTFWEKIYKEDQGVEAWI